MELKVSVDGVQRVVCGVTDKTTCQEVVIALAQALGRTGRYTLKEKFKDFERNVTPDERLLESLAKYGQQSREVRLTLLHNGPSLGGGGGGGDGPRRGSQQACTPLRRGDIGVRGRRGSSSCASHRQSLPPLSRLRLSTEPPQRAEAQKPKRKSLMLVEEAFGWLENLSRGGKPHRGKEKSKEPQKRKGCTSANSPPDCARDCCDTACLQGTAVTLHQQRESFPDDLGCGRQHVRDDNGNCKGEVNKNGCAKRDQELNTVQANAERKPDGQPERKARVTPPSALKMEDKLEAMLIHQQTRLHELQMQLDSMDAQIWELEERQTAGLSREAEGKLTDEESEGEEIEYWKNELRAEEGYERDLQEQFLEMKERATDCKARLEDYKCRLQEGLELTRGKRTVPDAERLVEPGQENPAAASWTEPHASAHCGVTTQDVDHQQTKRLASNRAEGEKRPIPTAASLHPRIRLFSHQTTDSQGKGQLQEWWARCSDSQNLSGTRLTAPVLHRSELTIQLSSTRV